MSVENDDWVWDNTDPAIKLFGRDIPFASSEPSSSIATLLICSQQDAQSEAPHFDEEDEQMEVVAKDLGSSSSSNDGCEEVSPTCSQKVVGCIQNVAVAPSPPTEIVKVENVQGLAAPEKTSKKPDRPIPCPRCVSMDTKFCYFNNYNVNQPRHFCRKCQRYWTAGGSLRNVPVGAGRRKNKHSPLHQRHPVVPDTMKVRSDSSDMASQTRCSGATSSINAGTPSKQLTFGQQKRLHVPALNVCATPAVDKSYSPSTKCTVSGFSQGSPLCKSTTLTMPENAALQNHRRFNASQIIAPPDVKVERDDNLLLEHKLSTRRSIINAISKHNDASIRASIEVDNHASENLANSDQVASGLISQIGDKESTSCDDYVKQVKETGFSTYCGPWQLGSSIPWNNPANTGAVPTLDGGAVTLYPPNLQPCHAAAPGGLWPRLPWPLMYPPTICPPLLDWAGSWAAMQWGPAAAAAAILMQHSGLVSTVRNHHLESSQSDGCLWVPKTLRIDDPVDAARSSIWTTLGLGDGPASPPLSGAPNIFQAKSESKDTNDEHFTTPNRHSNPAALSRSAAFNENS